jgi:hypothetical protein
MLKSRPPPVGLCSDFSVAVADPSLAPPLIGVPCY